MRINQSSLNRIMKYYTLTTLILLLLLPTLVTGVIYVQRRDALQMEMTRISKAIAFSINQRSNEVIRLAQTLTSNSKWEEELSRYFNESYSEHHTFYLINGAKGYFLPNEISRQYLNNRYLKNIQISYRDVEELFVSQVSNPRGKKQKQGLAQSDLTLVEPLRSVLSFDNIGMLMMTYSLEQIAVDNLIAQESSLLVFDRKKQTFIGIDQNEQLNLSKNISETMLKAQILEWQKEYYLVDETTVSDHQIFYLVPKRILRADIFKIMVLIFATCSLTAGAISFYIFKQLKKYAKQVADILDTTNRIQNGQIYYRISENDKEAELKEITHAINNMLDGQQENIRKVYHLEVQRSEAVLKALQAQINPHFLYNTLEFIRMSAYLEGADQLAEFVYDFSILMRNNITDEKEKTIAQEIYFIQKYLNLYQARYPNKLSVYIEVDEELNEIMIPKFTLQPLIENYLVHGIDFSEPYNELTISITKQDRMMVFEIADNGFGMDDEKIQQLNDMIDKMIVEPTKWKESYQRLGISIVAQRLGQFFGPAMKMFYQKNSMKGVTVWIQVPFTKENIMS